MYLYIASGIFIITVIATIKIAKELFGATKLPISGPLHLPLIGSLYEFNKNKDRFYDWMLDNYNKYGKNGIFYFSIPMKQPYIVILKPEYLKHVLKDNMDNYHREPVYTVCDELLGNGIFNVDGMQWKTQRRIASHMFSTAKLNNKALESFKLCINKIIKRIDYYAENNITFDIKDLFFRTTMDSICLIAFDYNVGCLDSDTMPEFANSIDKCTRHLFNRIINPLWRIHKIVSLNDEIEYAKNIKILNKLCYKIIKQRRKEKYNDKEISEDLLTLFMNSLTNNSNDNSNGNNSNDNNDNDDNNNVINDNNNEVSNDNIINNDEDTNDDYEDEITEDDKYLRDIIFSFIIAGRDTTASTLSWLFYELLTKPDIVEELQEEISDNINNNNHIYDYNNYKKIEAAFYETLRLHPPVPFDIKYSKNDDILINEEKNTGTFIPKNSTIIYSPYIMGRMPEIWGNKYNEFDINREHKKKTQFEFPCFNAGPRLCLGKTFAILQAKVIVSELLSRFTFYPENKKMFLEKAKYSFGITSTMNHKLIVSAKKI
ncbi:cytochrome P450 family protein [Hokovirus HKV1]|uniref:Cytochrome P450 family protein n=1 Tax=Hokovirus HKV1 TaxID=1977638 RepID=A0A1V0SF03_9VIRU|nr:cytochrome P450 family protein [Hokovirus HKV1]